MALSVHLCFVCLVVASYEYEFTRHINAWAGQNVTFECLTSDNPGRGQWRRGHDIIYTENDIVKQDLQHRLNIFVNKQKNEYNLKIFKVIPDDSDVYTCRTEKGGNQFFLRVMLNVSELEDRNTEKEKTRYLTEKSGLENTSFITTVPTGHKTRFSKTILYLFGGSIGAVVVILFCASLLFLFVNKNRTTKGASLDTHHALSGNTDSQRNPYGEIDEETASFLDTRRTDNKNSPSSYLNVLHRDSLQSAINAYELIECDAVTPGLNIAIASGSCVQVGPNGDLPQNEYHMYEEVTEELISQGKKVTCNSAVKQTEYYNSNQGNVNSRLTNEIYRNTYQALQPNWQTPTKLYSRLTLDNL